MRCTNTEEANEYLGSLAAHIDDSLSIVGPEMTFALVVWKKGKANDRNAIACLNPPEITKAEAATAFRTLAAALEEMSDG